MNSSRKIIGLCMAAFVVASAVGCGHGQSAGPLLGVTSQHGNRDTGSLTVTLGMANAYRVMSTVNDIKKFVITLTDGNGTLVQTGTISTAQLDNAHRTGQVDFKNLPPGTLNIEIKALDRTGALIGIGTESTEIVAGMSVPVRVTVTLDPTPVTSSKGNLGAKIIIVDGEVIVDDEPTPSPVASIWVLDPSTPPTDPGTPSPSPTNDPTPAPSNDPTSPTPSSSPVSGGDVPLQPSPGPTPRYYVDETYAIIAPDDGSPTAWVGWVMYQVKNSNGIRYNPTYITQEVASGTTLIRSFKRGNVLNDPNPEYYKEDALTLIDFTDVIGDQHHDYLVNTFPQYPYAQAGFHALYSAIYADQTLQGLVDKLNELP